MSTFDLMPPGKNKKRFEVHFTEPEVKGFEKIRKGYPRMSMKRLMETLLLSHLPNKGVKYKITVINESGAVKQKAFNKLKPKKK